MQQAFSLQIIFDMLPRALPWASMREAVGLDDMLARAFLWASTRKAVALEDMLEKADNVRNFILAGIFRFPVFLGRADEEREPGGATESCEILA